MSIRLIALDLDGTTLNHEGKLPEANRAAFAEAFKKNAAVVVCTGRALQTVPKELLEVDEIRYLITSNGARIIDRKLGRDLYQSFLSPAAVRILPELIEKYGLKLEVFRDGQAHIEKSVFELLLRARHPVIWALGRALYRRYTPEVEEALAEERILIFAVRNVQRTGWSTAQTRNFKVADMADEDVFAINVEGRSSTLDVLYDLEKNIKPVLLISEPATGSCGSFENV